MCTIFAHARYINSLNVSENRLVSTGEDGFFRVWEFSEISGKLKVNIKLLFKINHFLNFNYLSQQKPPKQQLDFFYPIGKYTRCHDMFRPVYQRYRSNMCVCLWTKWSYYVQVKLSFKLFFFLVINNYWVITIKY